MASPAQCGARRRYPEIRPPRATQNEARVSYAARRLTLGRRLRNRPCRILRVRSKALGRAPRRRELESGPPRRDDRRRGVGRPHPRRGSPLLSAHSKMGAEPSRRTLRRESRSSVAPVSSRYGRSLRPWPRIHRALRDSEPILERALSSRCATQAGETRPAPRSTSRSFWRALRERPRPTARR